MSRKQLNAKRQQDISFHNSPEKNFFKNRDQNPFFSEQQFQDDGKEIDYLSEIKHSLIIQDHKDLNNDIQDLDAWIDQVFLSQSQLQQTRAIQMSQKAPSTQNTLQKPSKPKRTLRIKSTCSIMEPQKIFQEQVYKHSDQQDQYNPDSKSNYKIKKIKKNNKSEDSRTPKNILFLNQNKRKYELKKKPIKRPKISLERKGKSQQSSTQLFIRFMTGYYYNKNFSQYYTKRITQKKYETFQKFLEESPKKKIKILDQIIQGLSKYQMQMSQRIRNSQVFQQFSEQNQKILIHFFQQIMRNVYRIKFQTQKRRIHNQNTNIQQDISKIKFFDAQGQRQFEKLFDQILQQKIYRQSLLKSNLKETLMQVIKLK